MVQGYPQKNSGSSSGWCSLGSNIGVRAVFSFRGTSVKEGQPFSPCMEQPLESVQRPECASRAYIRGATLSNDLHILQKDLDYPGLYRLIQKVDGLC